MRRAGVTPIFACLLLVTACTSGDPLERLFDQLSDQGRRVQAIDELLIRVRRSPDREKDKLKARVIHALMDAYRDDHHREEIVTALALLKDPRAEPVYVAALKDAQRGGGYFEAAIRAARIIGELGLKRRVPAVVEALRKAHDGGREERNTWLQRTLIQTLDQLGDRRALEGLIGVLKADPVSQDFFLNRLAARALGRMGDPRAVKPLVESLGATSHGLLLFEESRRALCRIGTPAVGELLEAAGRRDRRELPVGIATSTLKVLGDVAGADLLPRLEALVRESNPDNYRLALAETLLGLGSSIGRDLCEKVLASKASLTGRRRAAELLGWYGYPAAVGRILDRDCKKEGTPGDDVLCWSVALAFHRAARGEEGLKRVDALLARRKGRAAVEVLKRYRPRLVLAGRCKGESGCLREALTDPDWRVQERAALDLGRGVDTSAATLLASRLKESHPQVQRAIAVSLRRLALDSSQRRQVRTELEAFLKRQKSDNTTPSAITSDLVCLSQRMKPKAGE